MKPKKNNLRSWAKLEWDLIESEPFRQLSGREMWVLIRFHQKIKGMNPLIEVKINNPLTHQEEFWYVRNKKNAWNREGLSYKNNTAEKRFVSSEIFEGWHFRSDVSKLMNYLENSKVFLNFKMI